MTGVPFIVISILVAIALQRSLLAVLVLTAQAALIAAILYRLARVQIGRDGLSFGVVTYLRWADVRTAQRKLVFGQEYLKVTRVGGLPFWIPLNLVGARDFQSALAAFVPHGNAIRACLSLGE